MNPYEDPEYTKAERKAIEISQKLNLSEEQMEFLTLGIEVIREKFGFAATKAFIQDIDSMRNFALKQEQIGHTFTKTKEQLSSKETITTKDFDLWES